jgi:uncharacterized protein (TIGR03083 family)
MGPVTGSSDATRHIDGIDPHPLLEAEQLCAIRFFGELDDEGWQVPTACPGWRRRDMLAHLASSEDYNLSTLDGTREAFIANGVAAGAHDLDSFNDWGVRIRSDRSYAGLLEELSEKSAATRSGLRERGDGEIDTMAGPYPARLQAFHLAFEAAIHNDDMDVPVPESERPQRDRWRAATVRFMLAEASSPVELSADDGGTRVRASKTGEEAVFDDADLIRAASGRLRERAQRYPPALVEALRL